MRVARYGVGVVALAAAAMLVGCTGSDNAVPEAPTVEPMVTEAAPVPETPTATEEVLDLANTPWPSDVPTPPGELNYYKESSVGTHIYTFEVERDEAIAYVEQLNKDAADVYEYSDNNEQESSWKTQYKEHNIFLSVDKQPDGEGYELFIEFNN